MTTLTALKRTRQILARLGRMAHCSITPQALRLPASYWLYRLEGSPEPELEHLSKLCPAGGCSVDVGANCGYYSYALSRLCRKVYAFEINDELTSDMENFRKGNIEVIKCGLSSAGGERTLFVPYAHGLYLTGWGSLNRRNCPDATSVREKSVQVRTLDSFEIPPIAFIKIDVEGHELEVLKGASATILKNRPTILIEIREENLHAVRRYLKLRAYREHNISDVIGTENQPGNYLFKPEESEK